MAPAASAASTGATSVHPPTPTAIPPRSTMSADPIAKVAESLAPVTATQPVTAMPRPSAAVGPRSGGVPVVSAAAAAPSPSVAPTALVSPTERERPSATTGRPDRSVILPEEEALAASNRRRAAERDEKETEQRAKKRRLDQRADAADVSDRTKAFVDLVMGGKVAWMQRGPNSSAQ